MLAPHTVCSSASLYTALIALLCPLHLINWSCCEIWHRAPCCCGLVSYLCLVVLLTMVSKHYYLADKDKWQEEVIGFFSRGKDVCQF